MNRLKELREQSGLSLGKLSQELEKKGIKIGRASLSNYERGEQTPKEETWHSLADYFKVSVPYIMGLSNEKNDETSKNSEEIAKFIMNSTDIEEIAVIMKEVVTSGNIETASKITGLLGNFALLLSDISKAGEPEKLDNLQEIILSISDIMKRSLFFDLIRYNDEIKEYHQKYSIAGKSIKEVREIEKKFPKPNPKIKSIEKSIIDFQTELSKINEKLTADFSDTVSKIYKK
ncbi:helix-turn-helix domain-containing protein [Enterococcus dongliensis]|uniref:helix-turn-helix domain-containing protein n=1 Tax=Enterococcus dongliensis TaxID=2559925 RepID=UPI00289197D0|nr:helix-turn-helix domain-containing protein [Enterococcus dongliensis]MDT2673234.1 helix-turn-helix domain-containing protein [Enterococcus dongliensis]